MESVTLSLPEAYDLALEVLSANGFSADHAAAIARNVAAGSATAALPTACGGCWALSIPCVKVRYRLMPSRKSTIRRRRLRGRTPAALFRCWPTSARCRYCWRRRGTAALRRWRLTAASIFRAVCRY